MDLPKDQRERSDSSASTKRRRVLESEDEELAKSAGWREKLEAILIDDKNRISKTCAAKINSIFTAYEMDLFALKIKVSYLQGRLDERDDLMGLIKFERKTETYAEKAKTKRPMVNNRVVPVRTSDKVVILYPEDEAQKSEVTRTAVKEVLAPKKEGLQIRAMRNVNKGGVVIETGSAKSTLAIKEAAQKVKNIRCVEPRRIKPRMQVFDVERGMTESEFHSCLFKQNLEDLGVTEEEVKEGVTLRFKTGRRDAELCNWVVEVSSHIRTLLLDKGRVYLEYASCRVRDFLAVSRCYRCQGYGHLVKYCKSTADTCSHCGKSGHNFRDCPDTRQEPVCVHCLTAKKDSKHRVGTMECPIYVRAVERMVGSTHYNGM